ncbi:Protein CBG19852 [Caenorhabditis briggsae]|uniref:Protein CBG19852 n=1 Tax=Caenorhabditis briggsae TaxID=6238 RepID=A8XWL0_CAEBR|nr:Protein CBG19852 [Caenorhabditis briggsae]CAP37029.2 Protein CBG19852 [Caenorhabditis briggsae]
MSIDNLILFDCVHIDLAGFMFSEIDLNRYLKSWINRCNPRMDFLKAYGYFIDLEEALRDIDKPNVSPPKRFYTHDNLCRPFDAEGGITIRRNNKDLGTIKLEFAETPYSIPPISYFFTFVVWTSN